MIQITAVVKIRVGLNRLPRHLVESDVLRRQFWRGGDYQRVFDAVRVVDAPLHHLHAAEAAADHRAPVVEAQRAHEAVLGMHPVLYRHDGEIRPPVFIGSRFFGVGAAAALAAAEVVDAHHKKAVGVDGLAGADGAFPPAGLAVIHAVVASGVLVARQRVANQNRIAAVSIALAVGFVGDVILLQRFATFEHQRLVEMHELRFDQANGIGGKGFGHSVVLRKSAASVISAGAGFNLDVLRQQR